MACGGGGRCGTDQEPVSRVNQKWFLLCCFAFFTPSPPLLPSLLTYGQEPAEFSLGYLLQKKKCKPAGLLGIFLACPQRDQSLILPKDAWLLETSVYL